MLFRCREQKAIPASSDFNKRVLRSRSGDLLATPIGFEPTAYRLGMRSLDSR